jgi:ribosomal protein L12E/L44/L45/RPP1/RPP2
MKGLLNSVGASIDEDLIDKVVTDLAGKDINDLIAK